MRSRLIKGSPAEPVLFRSSRQRLGHLQSHFDGGWHVCQAVFSEPQSDAACWRVERRDCAHEALPRLQSASSWLVMEQLVSVVCRVRSVRQATVLLVWGGAIPARMCTLFKFVGLRQPEMIRQQSCRAGFSLCTYVCRPRSHRAGIFGSWVAEGETAGLSVVALHPHFELASLRMMLFLAFTFILVFSMCVL